MDSDLPQIAFSDHFLSDTPLVSRPSYRGSVSLVEIEDPGGLPALDSRFLCPQDGLTEPRTSSPLGRTSPFPLGFNSSSPFSPDELDECFP